MRIKKNYILTEAMKSLRESTYYPVDDKDYVQIIGEFQDAIENFDDIMYEEFGPISSWETEGFYKKIKLRSKETIGEMGIERAAKILNLWRERYNPMPIRIDNTDEFAASDNGFHKDLSFNASVDCVSKEDWDKLYKAYHSEEGDDIFYVDVIDKYPEYLDILNRSKIEVYIDVNSVW